MNHRNSERARRLALATTFALVTALAGGCGGQTTAKPVDPDLARTTLKQALDHWKSGGKPEDLQAQSPKIIVQDPDWQVGSTLTSYEVVGDGEARDANLYCSVRLQIEVPEEGPIEETVTYCVGTDPVLTVFRDLFHSAP